MQNEGKTDNKKNYDYVLTRWLRARVEYANIDAKINQLEYNSSLTAIESWFNAPNLGG